MKEAGILLHISSLPSPYGIGTLGQAAYDFIDFLAESGQRIWQILPIGPTSYGDSPYSALSSFAANPYFIDLDLLVEDGLLAKEDLPPLCTGKTIDYAALYNTRYTILHRAYENRQKYEKEFTEFIRQEDSWLNDYALYMVLKREHENKPWNLWYDDFKYRNPQSMAWLQTEYRESILEYKFYQYLFFKQWLNLKHYANTKGIRIMGDMPIYCAYDSADVWANPSNYQLDSAMNPTFVAGCPPDAFTADGQLWGNPLYNYDKMEQEDFKWWVSRVQHSFKLFDILRIDHFRGFAGYYAIPYGDKTAKGGHWEVGPGYKLFQAIQRECPTADIVAENLGFLTPDVFTLLEECGYPGMHIFQFELGDGKKNIPLKKKFAENTIFYSGTHDNQTIMSFYHDLSKENKELVDAICKIKFTDRANLKIIEYCMKQNSRYCIIPLQDYLGLTDSEGRMNTPSTLGGNWGYRAEIKDFSAGLKAYLLKITEKYHRTGLNTLSD